MEGKGFVLISIMVAVAIALTMVGIAYAWDSSYSEEGIPSEEIPANYMVIGKTNEQTPVPSTISLEYSTVTDGTGTTIIHGLDRECPVLVSEDDSSQIQWDVSGTDTEMYLTDDTLIADYILEFDNMEIIGAYAVIKLGTYSVYQNGTSDALVRVSLEEQSIEGVTLWVGITESYSLDGADQVVISGYSDVIHSKNVNVFAIVNILSIFTMDGGYDMELPSMTLVVSGGPAE